VELIFERFLKKEPDLKPSVGSLKGWFLKAYVKMKGRAATRNRNWRIGIHKQAMWFSEGIKQYQM
jgi:hypothetical protein